MNKPSPVFFLSQDHVISEEPKQFLNRERKATLSNRSDLKSHLSLLANHVANVTEAYTAAIFLADHKERFLALGGVHTLSREFVADCRIGFGCGLVGWTAENSLRISVCPFEHDSSTLLYYSSNQDLKSFIALPILSDDKSLLGVLTCDSRKSYAFSKIMEKNLLDCSEQAAVLIRLHKRLDEQKQIPVAVSPSQLNRVLEELRNHKNEESLLWAAASLPQELITRDALVVVTKPQEGLSEGAFYSAASKEDLNSRLLDLVCRHKKVICGDRSVQGLPADDAKHRSFLSVPFRVMGEEAGSFNLLSAPHESFDALAISSLEKIATILGQELERIRLRTSVNQSMKTTGILSWPNFERHAQQRLNEARLKNIRLELVRISLENLPLVEAAAGIQVATAVLQRFMRLVEQVQIHPAISCYLYGSELLILMPAAETSQMISRLSRLIERLTMSDFLPQRKTSSLKLGALLLEGLEIAVARFPKDGTTLAQLTEHTLQQLEFDNSGNKEVAANA